MNGEWNEVRIVVPVEALEPVSGILYGMNVKGIAIQDPTDLLTRESGPLTWDYADINIFPEGVDNAVLTAYFPDTDRIEETVGRIREKIAALSQFGIRNQPFRVDHELVQEENWANSWKQYYKTMKVGERIIIKPVWEEYEALPGELVVEMDPGMAFGTGSHETTRLCVELLQEYIHGGETVIDVGTGSGILAIAAARLGAGKVLAIDLDPVAVDSARINVEYNKLSQITVKEGNLLDEAESGADVIIANIIADVIIAMAPDLKRLMKPGGIFIGSGIISFREEAVQEALEASGFTVLQIRDDNDWRAIAAKAP